MFLEISNALSIWAIPVLLLFIPLIAALRGVKVYEMFVTGAGEGFQTAVRVMPFLIAMMVAVSIFRDSGAMDFTIRQFTPLLRFIGVPEELVPLGLMRPLSGTGTMGMGAELLRQYGPDSLLGRMASVVMGSTDTTFYILTVYFGAVGIAKIRYALYVGLVGDIAGFFAAVYICRMVFGG